MQAEHRVRADVAATCCEREHAPHGRDDPANRPRSHRGGAVRRDQSRESVSGDLLDRVLTEHRNDVEIEGTPIALERSLGSIAPSYQASNTVMNSAATSANVTVE